MVVDQEAGHASAPLSLTEKNNLIQTIIKTGLDEIAELFDTFLHKTDEHFFTLADSAHSNSDQTRYFDSMRELRQKREALSDGFIRRLRKRMDILLEIPQQQAQAPQLPEAISLLDQDILELDIAVNAMVSRSRCDYPTLLLQLVTRINSLLGQELIDEENNPYDPECITHCFTDAADLLLLDLEARLTIYKQFERHLLGFLDSALNTVNELLIDAGVMADIRRTPTLSQRSKMRNQYESELETQRAEQVANSPGKAPITESIDSTQAAGSSATASTTSPISAPSLSQLQQLLHAINSPEFSAGASLADAPAHPISHAALFEWLQPLQQQHASFEQPLANSENLHQVVTAQLSQNNASEAPQALSRLDQDILNLVDMIFSYIFEQDLPAPILALIGRLQIPTLKMAISDASFFDDPQHPTRILINRIAEAAVGWHEAVDQNEDQFYLTLKSIVKSILDASTINKRLFQELGFQLTTFTSRESERSDRIATRTLQAEEGQARTEQAKTLITQIVRERLQGKELPTVVYEILNKPWQALLLNIYLKEGNKSQVWHEALKTADTLIQSVRPVTSEEQKAHWLKIVPPLITQLNAGLDRAQWHGTQREKAMSELWDTHKIMLSWPSQLSNLRTQVVDYTADEPQSLNATALKASRVSAECRQWVDQLTVGRWIEVSNKDTKTVRCKLAAKIRANDSYVFINRLGVKAYTFSRDELAVAVFSQRVKLLESGPLMDRALETLMTRLRQSLP